ncbi:hypothetical protein [Halobacterium noricense]|uniref:hypothetical protein n=1 Tax=Halobacterium noricense TaxID=223182 RepID=UPI001E487F09|nr:hypothetical protein [Halobacterium noricense]UHH27280.1 hypothetical protein LT974_17435 [Halobacterium noricense]
MALRSEQLREKYWSNDDDGGNARRQASIDEYDDGNGEPESENHAQTDLEEYEGTTATNDSTEAREDAEPAMDNQPDDSRMDSSDVTESSDEWSRSDADTASFSTNTQDHSASGEDENSKESSDD